MDKLRVLLTGGSGFIGHHTFEHIMKNTNFDVVILEGLNYAGSLCRLTDIENYRIWQSQGRITLVPHNIQFAFNDYVIQQIGKIDVIIHMAAETHVDHSIIDAYPFVMTNFVGTYNVLEFARSIKDKGLKRYVQISTDEVYGPAMEGQYFDEEDRVRPSNPYAACKEGADSLAYSYFVTHKLPVIITRTMNNFGERQHPEKFVIKVLKSLLNGENVDIHGSANNIGSRFWIHARNHASAVMFLIENGSDGEMYHIAGEEINNLQIAQIVADVVGRPLKYKLVDFHHCRPGHDRRYALSDKKIKRLGWSLPKGTHESLEKTIKWMMNKQEWLLLQAS